MNSKRRRAPHPPEQSDSLADAVDRMTAELRVLRQVLDEVREDFSWLTHNGVPVRAIEHVHVKRMALDPTADDWGEQLEIQCSVYRPQGRASPLESEALDQIVDDLKATLESAAQGQLEVVLVALDGVRAEILAALKRPRGVSPAEESERNAESGSQNDPPPPASKPPAGHLF